MVIFCVLFLIVCFALGQLFLYVFYANGYLYFSDSLFWLLRIPQHWTFWIFLGTSILNCIALFPTILKEYNVIELQDKSFLGLLSSILYGILLFICPILAWVVLYLNIFCKKTTGRILFSCLCALLFIGGVYVVEYHGENIVAKIWGEDYRGKIQVNIPEESLDEEEVIIGVETPAKKFINGEQITVYVNAKEHKPIEEYLDGYEENSIIAIGDSDIAAIEDGVLKAKKTGITYVVHKTGEVLWNHSIVVFDDAEHVTQGQILNAKVENDVVSCVLGETYQLSSVNSSDCDVSKLNIIVSTDYGNVNATELVTVHGGKITIVGIGHFELHIQSASNKQDEGVLLKVQSIVEDKALLKAIDDNVDEIREDFFTKTELKQIEELTITTLQSFSEAKWGTLLPNLQVVSFDLRETEIEESTYQVKGNSIQYKFIGDPEKVYHFSILAEECSTLDLLFVNMHLQANSTVIDLSKASKANLTFVGGASFLAKESNDIGYKGLYGQDISIMLQNGADLKITGGAGSNSSESGNNQGGEGIHTKNLSITSDETKNKLFVVGGRGGNGYSASATGGTGGDALKSDTASIVGNIEAEFYGGQGGHGASGGTATGNGGVGGAGGNGGRGGTAMVVSKNITLSKVTCTMGGGLGGVGGMGGTGGTGTTGAQGKTGGVGGQGGAGGNVISATSIETIDITELILKAGDGGTGGVGGVGGFGGQGEKGKDASGGVLGIGGKNGEKGGKGGQGGTGGQGGDGGDRGTIFVAATLTETETLTLHIKEAFIGDGGAGGNGGKGGKGGTGGKSTDALFSDYGAGAGGDGGQGGSGGDGGHGKTNGNKGGTGSVGDVGDGG